MAKTWEKRENATGIQFAQAGVGITYVPYSWLMKIETDEAGSLIIFEFTHLTATLKGKELKEVYSAGCEQTLSLVQSQTGTAAKTFINEISIDEKHSTEE